MDQLDAYRRNAEDADKKACDATLPDQREAYEKIAKGWRDLIANDTRRKSGGDV